MKAKVQQQVKVKTIVAKYAILEGRVHKSCDQLDSLNRKIKDLRVRQQRASQRGQRPFSKSLQLQLSVYESMYTTFYTYTSQQARQLATLERVLLPVVGQPPLAAWGQPVCRRDIPPNGSVRATHSHKSWSPSSPTPKIDALVD